MCLSKHVLDSMQSLRGVKHSKRESIAKPSVVCANYSLHYGAKTTRSV